MDIDKALLSALLREGKGALRRFHDQGLSTQHFSPESSRALKFLLAYTKDQHDLPTADVIFHATQAQIDPTLTGSFDFWAEAIWNRYLTSQVEQALLAANDKIKKPREALQVLEEFLRKMRKEGGAKTLIESLPGLGPLVKALYERTKAGDRGILVPWPSVNEATLGLWPEDLVLFAARLGIGKTWVSLLVAGAAWEQKFKDLQTGLIRGTRVLYATTEMSKERIAQRWYAIKLKLPYGQFRRGQLAAPDEKRFYEGVDEFVNSPDFMIVGGAFDFSIESFESAIEEANPDVVVVDGAYLLKIAGANRLERAANVFDELKRICKRRKLPIVVTMQFNRQVKADQPASVTAEALALTDVAGWNADLIYGLIQTEEMRTNRRMVLKPLKIREGSSEDLECNWDFEAMDFSELPRVQVSPTGAPPVATKPPSPSGTPSTTPALTTGQYDPSVPF